MTAMWVPMELYTWMLGNTFVFNSIGTHIAVMKSESLKKHKVIRILSGILMVAICMATVSLKQHSVLDVAGAILLSAAIYPLVYAGSTQEETENEPEYIR